MALKQAVSKFQLRLFGGFRLERDARLVRLPTHKVESLFAYLALFPEQHPREKLAALLWGDSTDEQARHSLRTALAAIRKELGEEILIADRESVQLNLDIPLGVDAREISNLRLLILDLDIENLKSTIDNYSDLLPDFYDDWIIRERERLRAIYIDALLQLAQHHREKSECVQVFGFAQKVLVIDPASEKAHQHLIFCFAAQGDRIAALKQYDECKKILRDELNAEPSSETTALRDQIMQELTGAPSKEAALTNLPNPLTSFVGREKEIEAIKSLFANTRLLTLTGVGGSGKTRLAVEIARAALPSFKNGVWWIELAILSDPALVPQQIAQALGAQESREHSLTEMLIFFIREKSMLIALDNCEHLIGACAELAEKLLLACPNLKIIATSREALNLTGETVWRVPSLAAPDIAHALPADDLMRYDAVQLFVQRAALVEPNWRLAGNESWVMRICARLNGIPLAIELAVARVKGLSVEQIAERIDDRFQLLASGSRTAAPRQQTLRGAIDWSYDLLSEKEQKLFRRLAIFVNGWTLPAATAVCSCDGLDEREMMDLLLRLTDKSLVAVMIPGGETRYHYLETIRQYALEKLDDAGEGEATRNRHLDYFLKFAEEAESKLRGAEQLMWIDRLQTEHDNLRAAHDWAQASEQIESGIRLTWAILWFWYARSHLTEGRERTARLLALLNSADKTLGRALMLGAAGWLAGMQGDVAAMHRLVDESLAIVPLVSEQNKRTVAYLLTYLGFGKFLSGDNAATRSISELSLALGRETDYAWVIAYSVGMLGASAMNQHEDATARKLLEESIAAFRALGDELSAAGISDFLALMLFNQGEYPAARSIWESCIAIARKLGDNFNLAVELLRLAYVERIEGNYATARAMLEESVEINRTLGRKTAIAFRLLWLADLARIEGDYARAVALHRESLTLFTEVKDPQDIAVSLEAFAWLAAAQAGWVRAARLFGAANALFEATGERLDNPIARAEHEQNESTARTQLGAGEFATAWEEGKNMTMEQAIEYALENVK